MMREKEIRSYQIRSYQNLFPLFSWKQCYQPDGWDKHWQERRNCWTAAVTKMNTISCVHTTTKLNQVCIISIQVQQQHRALSAMNRSPEGSRHQSNHPLNTSRENSCHTREWFSLFYSEEGKGVCWNSPTNNIISFAINKIYHNMR